MSNTYSIIDIENYISNFLRDCDIRIESIGVYSYPPYLVFTDASFRPSRNLSLEEYEYLKNRNDCVVYHPLTKVSYMTRDKNDWVKPSSRNYSYNYGDTHDDLWYLGIDHSTIKQSIHIELKGERYDTDANSNIAKLENLVISNEMYEILYSYFGHNDKLPTYIRFYYRSQSIYHYNNKTVNALYERFENDLMNIKEDFK